MTSALTRYEDDRSAPTPGQAAHDALVRAVLPAVVLFGVVVGIGLIITGPLHGLPAEQAVNRSLAAGRTATMNTWTDYGSMTGSTSVIAASTALAVLLLWWGTRQWWSAIVPALAVVLQLAVFWTTTAIIGRPRPDVPHLDQAPPTSSYPSGHAGAAAALWWSLALLAQRIRITWLRVLVTVVCVLVPFVVGYSRVYRGMHHVTDVVAGALNGGVCAVLAYFYLRRDTSAAARSREGSSFAAGAPLAPSIGTAPTSRTGGRHAAPVAPGARDVRAGGSDPGVPRAAEGVDAVGRQAHRHESQEHPAER